MVWYNVRQKQKLLFTARQTFYLLEIILQMKYFHIISWNGNWLSLEIEQFEDIKAVIRIRKPKKDRQHNGQKKKDKRANNGIQSITHNIKDPISRIPLKTGGELRFSGRVSSSCSTSLLNLSNEAWMRIVFHFFLICFHISFCISRKVDVYKCPKVSTIQNGCRCHENKY